MWRGDVLTRGSDVRSNMILNRVNWSCKCAWNLRRVNQYPYKHFSVAQTFLNKGVFLVQPSVKLSQQWEEIA